jgi:putative transposase
VSPTQRRDAVAFLVRRHKVSERRACRVIGQHRSTQRYVAVPVISSSAWSRRCASTQKRIRRWGYRRIHALLVEDGWAVNLKRVHRLWALEGLMVP